MCGLIFALLFLMTCCQFIQWNNGGKSQALKLTSKGVDLEKEFAETMRRAESLLQFLRFLMWKLREEISLFSYGSKEYMA
jgi:hypothetical protein